MKAELPFEVPCVINGKPVRLHGVLQFYHCTPHSHYPTVQVKTGKLSKQPLPASHAHHLCTYHRADAALTRQAIEGALGAKEEWENMPWHDRAAIFLKAADLISGKYRYEIMAATILGQGKNAWQAEIDAAAEVCFFLSLPPRFPQMPRLRHTSAWPNPQPLYLYVCYVSHTY